MTRRWPGIVVAALCLLTLATSASAEAAPTGRQSAQPKRVLHSHMPSRPGAELYVASPSTTINRQRPFGPVQPTAPQCPPGASDPA